MKIALCLASVLLAVNANAATIEGRVVAVADGDTVTVLDASKSQHKVRLSGIDAPEKEQAFGQRSKESLSNLLFGGTRKRPKPNKRDKYPLRAVAPRVVW